MTFTPNRAATLTQLQAFIPRAGRDYARMRNSDFGQGQHNHVSTLSPYIRHRLITERETVKATLAVHSLAESEKFVQEVFWRTYFKGWLEHRPHVWARYQAGLGTALETLGKDKFMRADYERSVSGETGIECFDSWAKELIDTGYLHNHARMWFASIWIFTLRLPWELGADFFMRHLLDGDPASNTLSWRWVGGLHTKGKTYLARPSNIERFTNGRFNPAGELASDAQPLTEPDNLFPDRALPESGPLPDAPFTVLIHEDDCSPETLLTDMENAAGYIGALSMHLRSPLPVSENVKLFGKASVQDALERIEGGAEIIEGDWAEGLIAACKAHGTNHIVTAYAPVGPAAQALAAAMPDLIKDGISMLQIVRPWDKYTWPYANAGFFKVKKKIPKILQALETDDRQGDLF